MREALFSLPVVGRLLAAIDSSYRRKLATALVFVLVITGAMTAGLYVQIGALLSDNVEQSMTATANSQADEMTEWNSQNRLVTRVMAEHPVFETGNGEDVREYLRGQQASRAETTIVEASVLDRQSLTVETSTIRQLEGTQVSELPWEERFAFQGFDDVTVSQPHKSVTGQPAVTFITPIRQQPGHLLAVTVDAETLFTRFDHPVAGGFTRVVDSNGTVVFADNRSVVLTQYVPGRRRAPSVSAGLRGEAGFTNTPAFEQSGLDGIVAAYAPVAGTDWVVIEHTSASEAYALARDARNWIAAVGLVALLAVFTVVAVLGTDVTRAVSHLADRAERIEAGEFDVSFDVDRRDEFGDLNRTLASTRDRLANRFEEVRETKESLQRSNEALEERSTMVSVLNRIFRHNVRNDVNVITGRVEVLAEQTDDEAFREELLFIKQKAFALAAISEQAQHIEQLIADEQYQETRIKLPDRLEDGLRDVRSAWPGASITVADPPGGSVSVCSISTLPVIFADVVGQIIDANDGSTAVTTTIERQSTETGSHSETEYVTVTVDDDGVGLPPMDVKAIEAGAETPLQHADGLELWCLEWAVNRSDGSLSLDQDGTVLRITLPVADEQE